MHGVLTTSMFEADAVDAGLSEDAIAAMVACLAANPLAGVVMRGTGGARKVLFAGEARGKSGGYRTIHHYGGEDVPLFPLALVDKDNLTKAECNALAAELSQLTDDYRKRSAARLAVTRWRI